MKNKKSINGINEISKGIISSFYPKYKIGTLQSETGEILPFKSIKNRISFQVGNHVTFIKVPDGRYGIQAANVTRAYLSNDGFCVVDRPNSHLHDGIESQLEMIIKSINCNDRSFFTQQLDFNYNVGLTECVKTDQNSEILYAVRKGRQGYSRFVKGRDPEPTSSITITLKKTSDYYIIITAFFGEKGELEPWDKQNFASDESFEFWSKHALIFKDQEIIKSTITRSYPWVGIFKTIPEDRYFIMVNDYIETSDSIEFFGAPLPEFSDFIDEKIEMIPDFLDWLFDNQTNEQIYEISKLSEDQLKDYQRFTNPTFIYLEPNLYFGEPNFD